MARRLTVRVRIRRTDTKLCKGRSRLKKELIVEVFGVFGVLGFALGTIGFVFGIICLSKITKLTAVLEAKGLLEEN